MLYYFLLSVVRVISASVNVVFIYDDKSVNTPKRDIIRKLVLFLLERKSCFDRMSLLKWFARRTGVISAYITSNNFDLNVSDLVTKSCGEHDQTRF